MTNPLFLGVALMVCVLALDAATAQQAMDPARVLPMVLAQRDAANTQIAYCAAQNADYAERIKSLETEIAKLKAEPK